MRTPRNIQSPYTATDFWNQFTSTTPRMAMFMKVTPYLTTDVTTIGLTSNTRDMTLPGHAGITFKSAAGMMPSSAQQSINGETTLEMTGIYNDDLFKRSDVIGGKWENARIEIFNACWDNTNLGELVIFSGFLGELKDFQTFFTAEGRGLTSKLSQDVSWVTQRFCRVKEFRNAQCGHTASTVVIDAETYNITYTGVLATGSTSQRVLYVNTNYWTGQFIPLPIPPVNYFQNGKVVCTSGLNDGISREISSNSTGGSYMKMALKRPFPFEIGPTDEFTLTAGCNRTLEDCQKYSNVINFRGEPFVPGLTQMLKVPRSDEWTVEGDL
jgi:hypothetical protein